MDSIIRGVVVYFVLMLVFRVSGRRTLAQITTFDFVVLLILSETVQEALIGGDRSMMHALLLVLTLLGMDIAFTRLESRSKKAQKWLDDPPLLLVDRGRVLEERLRANRVNRDEILSAARQWQGIERMEQIKYAILESSGEITIIPNKSDGAA
jgi:uncharacterized membrane protein YcaP (DUF421 family)